MRRLSQLQKQLAMAYCPAIVYSPVLKKLNQWIRTNTELLAYLAATGYVLTRHCFNPLLVKLLYYYLGEPF